MRHPAFRSGVLRPLHLLALIAAAWLAAPAGAQTAAPTPSTDPLWEVGGVAFGLTQQAWPGAVLEPRALDELIPDWRDDPPALATPAKDDRFMFLTATKAYRLPTPPQMHNHGNYIVSLGNVCRWLGA